MGQSKEVKERSREKAEDLGDGSGAAGGGLLSALGSLCPGGSSLRMGLRGSESLVQVRANAWMCIWGKRESPGILKGILDQNTTKQH